MKTYKELKAELNKLHKLQWSMTRHLGYVVEDHSEAQQRILKNTVIMKSGVPDHEGAQYVPAYAVKWASTLQRTIGRIQKQLNKNLKKIREIESQIKALPCRDSKCKFHQVTIDKACDQHFHVGNSVYLERTNSGNFSNFKVGGTFQPGEVLKVDSWEYLKQKPVVWAGKGYGSYNYYDKCPHCGYIQYNPEDLHECPEVPF